MSARTIFIKNELHIISITRDITEQIQSRIRQKQLEDQLHQAQRLESVGRLAGGVAHDLNNLLSPILGYGEMLQEDIAPNDHRREAVDQILQAAIRARDVIRQLLSFSRKQTMVIKLAGLNQVVAGFAKLLRRTIREDIEIQTLLAEDVPSVRLDVGQIEQVIMNLAVNAQDAMPAGGVLTIRTGSGVLDQRFCANHPGSRPGTYAMLTVSDTGCGMDDETSQHIFEPFFSTKGEHGTGLGLASVYGIVKQHDGYIWVESEPGKGTTFKICLPASVGSDQGNEAPAEKTAGLHGTETVLIAEDNDQILILGHNLLSRLGYTVLVAENGREALEVLDKQDGRVHLLLTDVVMPDMNGKKLFERASAKYPTIKVLYMSGYSGTVLSQRGVLEGGVQVIQKPFSIRDLATKVREVLDKE
jgi:signal transduction histidine kinase/ActR/RegA family two-component response regulator